MTIYFFIYNNYYNREFKREENINDYGAIFYQESNNLNFNPNDGITTTYTAGRQNNPYNGMCDYVIYSEDGTHITSRWFIIEQERTLKGQYKCTLRRDVVADNWDKIQNAPMFIEKATLNQDSPLIYNKENMSFNQIKTSEEEIKDLTGCAWIVGYLNRQYAKDGPQTVTIDTEAIPDYTAETFEKWSQYTLYSRKWKKLNFSFYQIPLSITAGDYTFRGYLRIKNDNIYFIEDFYITDYRYKYNNPTLTSPSLDTIKQNVLNAFKNYYTDINEYETLYIDDINSYNSIRYNDVILNFNKILKQTEVAVENEYYLLGGDITSNQVKTYNVTTNKLNEYLKTYTDNIFTGLGFQIQSIDTAFTIYRNYDEIQGTATSSQFGKYTITIPTPSNRLQLKDAPYDMFIMPYTDTQNLKNSKTNTDYGIIGKKTALSFAQGLMAAIGGGQNSNIYDIQILPYCPATGFITSYTTIDINNEDAKRVTEILKGETKVGAMIWCAASSGSITIPTQISVTDKKISNETEMYRLCSGNYSSVFEFSIAKNNGISGFNVDFTYIPYSPYIHVAPIFNGLYGGNFQDARGLIDQGDHSISYISDTWTNFVNNNKNYLNAFNRQIDNLEVNHKYQMLEGGISSITGALGTGATVGMVTGSPAAGIIAGAASLGAGIADQFINQGKYNEALDFTKDNFAFQLDNIQAQPNTLAKVVALTPNNKIFPILEKYTATDEEVKALCNKIRYNGMTVGVIGKVSDYIGNSWTYDGISDKGYIKGQIIQLDIFDDHHSATEIANELNKGVYTK